MEKSAEKNMERLRNTLREKHEQLATLLGHGDFNGLVGELRAKSKFSDHEHGIFRTVEGDSENQKKEKLRDFVKRLREKMSEDILKVFYDALLKFEYIEAAELIGQYLPQPDQNRKTAWKSTAEAENEQRNAFPHQDTPPEDADGSGVARQSFDTQIYQEAPNMVCKIYPSHQMFVCLTSLISLTEHFHPFSSKI